MTTIAALCSLRIPEEHVRDRIDRFLLLGSEQVAIDILGDRHRGVTEHLGDDPRGVPWASMIEAAE